MYNITNTYNVYMYKSNSNIQDRTSFLDTFKSFYHNESPLPFFSRNLWRLLEFQKALRNQWESRFFCPPISSTEMLGWPKKRTILFFLSVILVVTGNQQFYIGYIFCAPPKKMDQFLVSWCAETCCNWLPNAGRATQRIKKRKGAAHRHSWPAVEFFMATQRYKSFL